MSESVFKQSKDDELAQIRKEVSDLKVQISALNPRNNAGLQAKELAAQTAANIYGDGADGNITFDGTTDYNDFSSRSGTTYTLSRDIFGKTIIVNNGVTIKSNGFRIFATGDLINRGTIHANGNDGSDGTNSSGYGSGTNGTGGTGGAVSYSGGPLPTVLAGTDGGDGDDKDGGTNGESGTTGTSVDKSLGNVGTGGGGGGAGGVIILVYQSFTGSGTTSATGGTGGTGGSGGSASLNGTDGLSGTDGSDGNDGSIFQIEV